MNLYNLTTLIITGKDLAARQIVKDALREGTDWSTLERPPKNSTKLELAISASLAEMFAERYGTAPPAWTSEVGGLSAEVYLHRDGQNPRTQEYLKDVSPSSFRKRNLYTYRDYLDVL